MKTALLLACGLTIGACASTIGPSHVNAASSTPLHHNIPATFVGHPEGPIVYLCATQPRQYIVGNVTQWEEDHYLQYESCPLIPIE